jgi:hypothetical protein
VAVVAVTLHQAVRRALARGYQSHQLLPARLFLHGRQPAGPHRTYSTFPFETLATDVSLVLTLAGKQLDIVVSK